ncbi:MAG: hypothetical protein R8M45_06545 [Ghiorsea sp.]
MKQFDHSVKVGTKVMLKGENCFRKVRVVYSNREGVKVQGCSQVVKVEHVEQFGSTNTNANTNANTNNNANINININTDSGTSILDAVMGAACCIDLIDLISDD